MNVVVDMCVCVCVCRYVRVHSGKEGWVYRDEIPPSYIYSHEE